MTGLHNRMLSMVDDKLDDFRENLDYEDLDSEGVLPIETFVRTMRESDISAPVDEELEFLEFCAMRVSDSLRAVKYEKLCEIFDEDYIFSPSSHEDKKAFKTQDVKPDEQEFVLPDRFEEDVSAIIEASAAAGVVEAS